MPNNQHRNALAPDYELHWYRIIRILGQGAFGITYLARDLNLDRDVAIKEYLPIDMAVREGDHSVHPVSDGHGNEFKWGLERFISEARTLAKFDHANVVRVYSVFEENNTGYMVMRYEEGQNLHDKIKQEKTISEAEILAIIMPILNGLELIHKQGFIHRDIKPDNIYIREDGSPVLIDFGSARQALGGKTRTLTSVLTPGYAPIEQYYSKSDEQGPWTDIYSLGATIYRAITGIGIHDAIDRSKEILEASRDSYVSAVELGEGKYSVEFLKAVDHSLQFHRNARPQSIQEWRHDFGFYTDKVAEGERDEAEYIATQLAQRDAVDLDLTGDFAAEGDSEKTFVIKEKGDTSRQKEDTSRRKGLNPVLIFIVLLVSVCGIAFFFPTQVINGISAIFFNGSEPETSSEAVTEVTTPQEREAPVEVIVPEVVEDTSEPDLMEESVAANAALELERERLAAEREEVEKQKAALEDARRQQEQDRLTEENRLLQEKLALAEEQAKKEQEEKALAEQARREAAEEEARRMAEEEAAKRLAEEEAIRLAEEARQKENINTFAVFLERLVFPDVNTLYRGVSNVCDFYSEDDPTACLSNITACKDFAQEDQGLFKFCAAEYVNKLVSLSKEVGD